MTPKPVQELHSVPPDFALVELRSYRRDLLLPRESDSKEEILLKRFTIVLGLAMNELKDIEWTHHQLTKKGPPKEKKHLGQYRGMLGTFSRFTAGVIVELGKSIAAAKQKGVLDSKTFKDALAKVRSDSRRTWDATVFSFTQREDSGTPRNPGPFKDRVHTLLKFIRNTTFHFDQDNEFKQLAKGYELQFTGPVSEFGRDRLYVSLGATQEQTRFYFADAAIIRLTQQKTEDLNVSGDEIRSFVRNLLNAVRYLLEALLKHFDATAPAENRSVPLHPGGSGQG
jgi:hypothetical protein